MPASTLIERVAELITSGEPLAPEAMRPQLAALARRLREPVRVAVVGRVNSGKSTIVNALLGQRVAPTDVSECTRLVCWFRYGHPQRVEVELLDGSRRAVPLGPDGRLPPSLPVATEQVRALQCFLANDTLRGLTIIDTPGIGSVHAEYSRATTDLLGQQRTEDAAQHADAVVFLFNEVVMQDELATLQAWRSSSGPQAGRSAANAVGVLSKADQLGSGGVDSWRVALELADRWAGQFRDDVAAVVPVIGLLAETAETASLTEADANGLAALAAMEPRALRRLLRSVDSFVSAEAPVAADDRERLLALLDRYGVEVAVEHVRNGAQGAVAVRRELADRSGVAGVKLTLDTYFRRQDHVLKVRSVLDVLDRLTYGAGADRGLGAFRSQIEALRLDPVMHPVAELEAWHDCCTGRADLPQESVEELRRLFAPGTAAGRVGAERDDPAAVAEAAKEAMVRWQAFLVTDASPAQAKVARVARRSYQLLWADAQRAVVG
jgi:hypothetical protein